MDKTIRHHHHHHRAVAPASGKESGITSPLQSNFCHIHLSHPPHHIISYHITSRIESAHCTRIQTRRRTYIQASRDIWTHTVCEATQLPTNPPPSHLSFILSLVVGYLLLFIIFSIHSITHSSLTHILSHSLSLTLSHLSHSDIAASSFASLYYTTLYLYRIISHVDDPSLLHHSLYEQ